MWGIDSGGNTTDVLGDYAEYWQPWPDVVDAVTGLPVTQRFMPSITLDV